MSNDKLPLTRRRHRRSLWFFGILTLLTLGAIVTLVVFNKSQLLKPEQLAAARERWNQNGPRDYDMEYGVKKQDGDWETYAVQVRKGKVTSASLDGRPIEPRQYIYYGMPALFEQIEGFLELDHQPGKAQTYTRAEFDKADGHLIEYVRRVMGSQERVQIAIKRFEPVSAERSKAIPAQ